MTTEREVFVPWAERSQRWLERYLRPRYPELEAPLMAAADAFDAAQRGARLTPEQLSAIVEAAASSRGALYENATDFLAKLPADWPEVRESILLLSRNPKAQVRLNALYCLGRSTPSELVDTVLRAGLVDKSARVRAMAASRTGALRNTRLIPDLTVALARETDEKARLSISFELRLLRDGFILEPEPHDSPGGYNLTVRTRDGGCSMTWVTEADLRARGIDVIAAERRNR